MDGRMMAYPLTLIPLLERARQVFGSVEIVSRRPDRSIVRTTYADLHRRARALAEGLQRAGLRRGDRVATMMWNHSAHLEAYFGIPAAGGVLHTLNLRLHPDELAYIVNHAEDRFLIVDDVLLPILTKIRDKVNFERVWVNSFPGTTLPEGPESYDAMLAEAKGDFAYPDLGENDAAAMCYTSGTTGKPKGVLYSHRAMVLHSFAMALPDACAMSFNDCVLQASSMFHANGWGFPYTATMVGAKLVFPGPNVDGESLLDLICAEEVTLANGVPTVWIGVCDALDKHAGRWKVPAGLRVLSAGSAVPESLMRNLDPHGIRIFQGWGMTETTPLATMSHVDPEERKQAAEAQAQEREVPWDGQSLGELHIRGPWIAESYFNMPEAQDRWTEDGWFRTGDVVSIYPNGCIRIADRAKDLIKSGGEWISSVDLENALMNHPAVQEAAVVGVPHPKWQERPLAVVVCRNGAQVGKEELREFLAARFAKWQLPDAIVFAGEIPRTSVGKFLKSRLREQYSNWKWEP
ncbi:MAG: long-chain fatty acid--CoA ligase [Acidobacteria bacterium]|nr:long-chain fatty acid--CoA ligase [Acidobacteriota bacterium]